MSEPAKRARTRRATFGSRFRRRFLEPAAFRRIQRRAAPLEIVRYLSPDPSGRADRGRRLARGRYDFAGAERETPAKKLWTNAPEELPWRLEAHGFEWLNDLSALSGATAAAEARQAVAAWLAAHRAVYDETVWRIDVTARRLCAFLLNAELLLGPRAAGSAGGPLDSAAFRASLRAHFEWLRRGHAAPPPGLDRLTAAVALSFTTLMVDEWSGDETTAVGQLLESAVDSAIGPDGAVIDRSPESTWRAYSLLSQLRAHAEAIGEPVSAVVLEALARLGPALRFFRAADGGLALFHGSRELADGRVDLALASVKAARAPSRRLTDAAFERLTGGRVTVLFDGGSASNDAAAAVAHASALALELYAGRRRLIVNCGAGWALDAEWAQACRGAPAQSTLTIDGTEFVSKEVVDSGLGEQLLIKGPPNLTVERKEERNGVWLMGSHDGYKDLYGLRLTRRLFLSADGGDFRGEDTAHAVGAEGRKLLERQVSSSSRRRASTRGSDGAAVPLRARFHLHPQVSAAVVADGEAITLRLPHGEVWVMRQAGGALSLDDSVYLGPGGDPEPTRQIVITANVRQERTQIRWAFRRVGELSQLPKDIEALLAETSLRADAPQRTPDSELAPIAQAIGQEVAQEIAQGGVRKR